LFQSSPGLVTGRYVPFFFPPSSVFDVSILARSGDRALLLLLVWFVAGADVSILARSGDRALLVFGEKVISEINVSILARSGDRALQGGKRVNVYLDAVSILARSGDRALHGQRVRAHDDGQFQSSPGLVTGRYITITYGTRYY